MVTGLLEDWTFITTKLIQLLPLFVQLPSDGISLRGLLAGVVHGIVVGKQTVNRAELLGLASSVQSVVGNDIVDGSSILVHTCLCGASF